jgi:type II secretory pathway pseudopilin PulG
MRPTNSFNNPLRLQGSRRSSLRSAFSLIELTLCIIIMSTLSGIAIPRFANSISNQRANATANRIAADLARAQRYAKYSSTATTISFTASQNSYQIVGMKDIDRAGNTYTIKLSDRPYKATITSATFGTDANLIFNGFGVPDSAGSVAIQVGSFTKTISVAANTGQVTIQ